MSHESTSLKKSSSGLLKHGKAVIQHFEWNDAISELLLRQCRSTS